jgi:hypothetical protein
MAAFANRIRVLDAVDIEIPRVFMPIHTVPMPIPSPALLS